MCSCMHIHSMYISTVGVHVHIYACSIQKKWKFHPSKTATYTPHTPEISFSACINVQIYAAKLTSATRLRMRATSESFTLAPAGILEKESPLPSIEREIAWNDCSLLAALACGCPRTRVRSKISPDPWRSKTTRTELPMGPTILKKYMCVCVCICVCVRVCVCIQGYAQGAANRAHDPDVSTCVCVCMCAYKAHAGSCR
jgi:hypothetical protein